jgi:hypothetical protein
MGTTAISPRKFQCDTNSCPVLLKSTPPPGVVYAANMFALLPNTIPSLYIAVDKNQSAIVVAFEGTSVFGLTGLPQLLASINSALFPALPFRGPTCTNCLVARGYLNSWASVSDTVVSIVRGQLGMPGQGGYRVVFTGHSLGGAIAGVAAAECRSNGTFGRTTVDLVRTSLVDELTPA